MQAIQEDLIVDTQTSELQLIPAVVPVIRYPYRLKTTVHETNVGTSVLTGDVPLWSPRVDQLWLVHSIHIERTAGDYTFTRILIGSKDEVEGGIKYYAPLDVFTAGDTRMLRLNSPLPIDALNAIGINIQAVASAPTWKLRLLAELYAISAPVGKKRVFQQE